MKIIAYLLKELKRPDDQGMNWYAWATNQMSHAFLGLALASVILTFFTGAAAMVVVFVFAFGKELLDIMRGGRFKDSLQDLAFQLMGGFLAVSLFTTQAPGVWLAVGSLVAWIIGGIVPRARIVLKRLKV